VSHYARLVVEVVKVLSKRSTRSTAPTVLAKHVAGKRLLSRRKMRAIRRLEAAIREDRSLSVAADHIPSPLAKDSSDAYRHSIFFHQGQVNAGIAEDIIPPANVYTTFTNNGEQQFNTFPQPNVPLEWEDQTLVQPMESTGVPYLAQAPSPFWLDQASYPLVPELSTSDFCQYTNSDSGTRLPTPEPQSAFYQPATWPYNGNGEEHSASTEYDHSDCPPTPHWVDTAPSTHFNMIMESIWHEQGVTDIGEWHGSQPAERVPSPEYVDPALPALAAYDFYINGGPACDANGPSVPIFEWDEDQPFDVKIYALSNSVVSNDSYNSTQYDYGSETDSISAFQHEQIY